MSRPFFSIIMPIYNAEKTLKTAVVSILQQIYEAFELVLVNDGSQDGSSDIIEIFAAQDARIHTVQLPQNMGLSHARNAGLDCARGEYVQFMDADDEVDAQLLQTVYRSLSENPADVAIIGVQEIYLDVREQELYRKTILPGQKFLRGKNDVRLDVISLEQKTLFGYAWNKFYLRERIENLNLRYENVPLVEDFLFNAAYFEALESANLLNIAPYYYKIRSASNLTARYVEQYFQVHHRRIQTLYDLHKQWGLLTNDVKKVLGGLYARYILSATLRNCDSRSGMSRKRQQAWLRGVYQTPLFIALKSYMRSDALVADVIDRVISGNHTALLLMIAHFVHFVKEKRPEMFARAKQSK